MTIETIRFRNDTQTRKRLMAPESFQHPAKGQLGMWALMVERYSLPGDLILDLMAGSGATLLAALMGRAVIVNELEHHFLLPMVRSWAKMRQNPMLGFQTGDVQFLWGDARNLKDARLWPYQELALRFPKAPDLATLKSIRRKYRLPLVTGRLSLPDASVGAAITSPPYANRVDDHGVDQTGWDGFSERFGRYTRAVDAIVTSPPFQETTAQIDGTPTFWEERNRRWGSRVASPRRQQVDSQGYTRPIDAIVTSPPYGETNIGRGESLGDVPFGGPNSQARGTQYAPGIGENIGNLRGGDLYALMVYNRLRREPNQLVEVHLCEKCLPAEIAESLLALTIPVATNAQQSGTPRTAQESKPISLGGGSNTSALVEPESPESLSDVENVPERISAPFSGDARSLLNGEPRLEQPIMASLSRGKQAQTTSHGMVAGQDGEALLGVSSDGRCLNETTTPVPNAALRNGCVSIISKVQRKLAENGITASETWLLSATPVTSEVITNIGCLLCNASLAANPSRQGAAMPNTALRLRFVTPNIVPLRTIAGRQSDYWTAQNEVYAECWRVLRPGGLMALVLKGFTREGQYVDLPGQTETLLLEAGWQKHDHWRRELWSLSFWRTLQKRRDPAAFDNRLMYEEVLAFRKPDAI